MELNGVTRFCLGIFFHALPHDLFGYAYANQGHRMAARVLKSAEYSTGFQYPAAAT